MSNQIKVQCTDCGKQFKVSRSYVEIRFSTLCDCCLMADQDQPIVNGEEQVNWMSDDIPEDFLNMENKRNG